MTRADKELIVRCPRCGTVLSLAHTPAHAQEVMPVRTITLRWSLLSCWNCGLFFDAQVTYEALRFEVLGERDGIEVELDDE